MFSLRRDRGEGRLVVRWLEVAGGFGAGFGAEFIFFYFGRSY